MKLLALLILLSQYNAIAANYYLSKKGSDNNIGTSKVKPWRTLKKLNEFVRTAHYGDSIFFERGSIFNGQLEISSSGLYLGAYGSGAKPIIRGSIELKNWTLIKANIWGAKCPDCISDPNNLFIDGMPQPLGRYPNNEYLSISGYTPIKNQASDRSSSFQDGYWNNAELVIKSSRWTIDRIFITKYSDKTFTLLEKPSYDLQPGFGYFIQKHLSTLDRYGEWYFDSKDKHLYVYMKSGFVPSQHHIELSKTEVGLNAEGANNLIIENIVFDKQSNAGVRIKNSANIMLNKIEISHSGKNGLEMIGCKNSSIDNSKITDSNNNGIEWSESAGGKFTYNTIKRSGNRPGRGGSGNGNYIAFYLTSLGQSQGDITIEYNKIDSTGYSAIDFRTAHTQIKNNTITNFCLIKDDGGGIYTWKNTGGDNIIEGNTIRDGQGSGNGTINKEESYASGIYLDDHSSEIVVKNNVVSKCSMAGIFLHNAHNIQLVGNTLYSNGNIVGNREKAQLYIKTDNGELDNKANLNLEVTQNKLMASNETSFCLFLNLNRKEDFHRIGVFGQNQFSALLVNQAVAELHTQFGLCSAPEQFSLQQWQLASTNEIGSSFKIMPSNGSLNVVGRDLIAGEGLEGWMSWPEKSFIEKEKGDTSNSGLKINIPVEIKEALLYHQGIYLNEKKLYRLTFSVKSAKPGKVEFVPLMANSPWAAIGKYSCFSVDATYKTFTYYFKCEKNDGESRINFKGNSTFWIKEVALFEVGSDSEEKKTVTVN
jgi:parallel beta-helix repeat protein